MSMVSHLHQLFSPETCPSYIHRWLGKEMISLSPPPRRPTVSPLLTPITSRNVLFLQSLPHSIPYRQDNVRRRKDDTCVGTATRGIVKRLSRVPCHLPSDARSSRCVRRALPAGACVRGCPPPRAPLPPRAPVPIATQEC